MKNRGRAAVAEIGWVIDPAHGGRGLATEAVWSLADFCFTELGVHRVQASCFADNVASWRLMERIGMHREGHTRGNALHRTRGWLDGYHYALLEQDWPAAAAAERVLTLLVDSRGSDKRPGGPWPTWIRSRGCPRRTTARAGVGPQPRRHYASRDGRPTRLRRPTTAETSTEPIEHRSASSRGGSSTGGRSRPSARGAGGCRPGHRTADQRRLRGGGGRWPASYTEPLGGPLLVACPRRSTASVGSGVWNGNLGGSREWTLRLVVCCAPRCRGTS